MPGPEWLAGLSGLAALIAALFAIWTKVSQQKTTNVQQVFESQRLFMQVLQQENADFRERQTKNDNEMRDVRREVNDLRIEVASCEADKRQLRVEVDLLREQVRGRTSGS